MIIEVKEVKCPKCGVDCEKRPTEEKPLVWWCHYCCVTYPYDEIDATPEEDCIEDKYDCGTYHETGINGVRDCDHAYCWEGICEYEREQKR